MAICGKRTARFMCTLEAGHGGPHGRQYRRDEASEHVRCSRWHVVKGESGDVRVVLSEVDGRGAFVSLSPAAARQMAVDLCVRAIEIEKGGQS